MQPDQVQTEDGGAIQLREEVHHASYVQKILTAEDTATASQHDHPTHRDLVQEAQVSGEVHQVPHYNKHVKGVTGITGKTVEDMIIETTRPGPARRRTPRSNTMVDDDAVEETTEEESDAYDEEFHRMEGGIMLCCDVRHKVLRT